MKFEHDGRVYYLEFQRRHRDVTVFKKRQRITIRSKHPFTTVRLLTKDPDLDYAKLNIVKDYTVGCLPTDKFSNEAGRQMALRGLTDKLSKSLRTAIWDAYNNRAALELKATKA